MKKVFTTTNFGRRLLGIRTRNVREKMMVHLVVCN